MTLPSAFLEDLAAVVGAAWVRLLALIALVAGLFLVAFAVSLGWQVRCGDDR